MLGIALPTNVAICRDAAYCYQIAHDHSNSTACVRGRLICPEGLGANDIACRPGYIVQGE